MWRLNEHSERGVPGWNEVVPRVVGFWRDCVSRRLNTPSNKPSQDTGAALPNIDVTLNGFDMRRGPPGHDRDFLPRRRAAGSPRK